MADTLRPIDYNGHVPDDDDDPDRLATAAEVAHVRAMLAMMGDGARTGGAS